jgi:hypothetical protein
MSILLMVSFLPFEKASKTKDDLARFHTWFSKPGMKPCIFCSGRAGRAGPLHDFS